MSKERPERRDAHRRITTALAIECLAGRRPDQGTLAARAGVSRKTVGRHGSRAELDGISDDMLGLVTSRLTSYPALSDLAVHAAGFDGSALGADGLQLWAVWFRRAAAAIVDLMSFGDAHRWVNRLDEFQKELTKADRDLWPVVWDRQRRFAFDGVSITGFMQGMAQAGEDWAVRGTSKENGEAEFPRRFLVGPAETTILDSLELYGTGGAFTKPDGITTHGHPAVRDEQVGYVAGCLYAGSHGRARDFAESHFGGFAKLAGSSRSELIRYLGARLMGAARAEPDAVLFPTQDEWRAARVVAADLAPVGESPARGMTDRQHARLHTWAAWIRGDLEEVLRQAPLIAGAHSIRTAVEGRRAWVQLPDLIPLVHEAAEATGRDDLAQFVKTSACAYLKDQAENLITAGPIPLGLFARLLALAVDATDATAFSWQPARPPIIDVPALTDVRVAVALGGRLDANVAEDLHEISRYATRLDSLTRVRSAKLRE